jgi:hypothetical protein
MSLDVSGPARPSGTPPARTAETRFMIWFVDEMKNVHVLADRTSKS